MSNSFKPVNNYCVNQGCDPLSYSNYVKGYSPRSFPLPVKEGFCTSCNASFKSLGNAFSQNPFAKLVKEEYTESMNAQSAYLGMNRAYSTDNFPAPTGGKSCISIK